MSGELQGKAVLVIEDDYLLATDLERALRGAGAEICGPFSQYGSEAREAVERGGVDCALLDINLGKGPSFDLADKLQASGVPFAFVTGYQSVPEAWRHVPLVNKPVELREVIGITKRLTGAN